jgi:hypothetical protein
MLQLEIMERKKTHQKDDEIELRGLEVHSPETIHAFHFQHLKSTALFSVSITQRPYSVSALTQCQHYLVSELLSASISQCQHFSVPALLSASITQ